MRSLLVVTALLEGMTGLALVVLPSRLATLLLGSSLDAAAALTLARVAGVALVALAVTCWLTRHDGQSRAARGLVAAMALYHTGVAIVLAYASIGFALSGLGLWPTGTVSHGHDRVVPQDFALKGDVCRRSACPVLGFWERCGSEVEVESVREADFRLANLLTRLSGSLRFGVSSWSLERRTAARRRVGSLTASEGLHGAGARASLMPLALRGGELRVFRDCVIHRKWLCGESSESPRS